MYIVDYGSPMQQVTAPVYSPGGNTYGGASTRGRTLHTHRQPDYYMAAPAPVPCRMIVCQVARMMHAIE